MVEESGFQKSLENLWEHVHRVLESNSYSIKSDLSDLVTYCENDDVLRLVTTCLKDNDVDVEAYYTKLPNSHFKLPLDGNTRLALLYKLLLKTSS